MLYQLGMAVSTNGYASLTTVYAAYFFVVRRAQIKELLKSSQSGLELAHCVRLILLSTIDIIICLPICVWSMADGIQNPVAWDSWGNVHAQWSRIVVFTDQQVLPYAERTLSLFLPRWGLPLLSLCAFLLIGTGHDAIRHYRQWLQLFHRTPSTFQPPEPCKPSPARVELGSTVLHATESTKSKLSNVEGEAFLENLDGAPGEGGSGVAVGIEVKKEVV